MSEEEQEAERLAPVLELMPGRLREELKITGVRGFCRCRRSVLDEETRVVTCRDCGKTLDAFDVLMEFARGERRWLNFEEEARHAAARLEQLKEEEKRTKARTVAASRKDANVAVEAERARTERARQDTIELAKDVAVLARRIEALQTRGARKDPRSAEQAEERHHGRS